MESENAVEELEVLPESQTPADEKPNLKGDWANFCLLMLLFVMQGVTFGFTVMALPIILQGKKTVTYEDQALFSLAQWPNSIKLLWAPIVDAIYVKWIGRRKSWLHPIQFLEGAVLIYLAKNINDWLPESGEPNILVLTIVLIVLNFLSSTENIVIDGWALTVLRKSNLGYSSASSSSGFALGTMLGSTIPVLITSEDFTVNYLRMTHITGSIITLERFLLIWGITIMLITTSICIFKKEKDHQSEDNHARLSIVQNYKLLWDILKLPNIRVLLIALLTMKIGYSAMRPALTNLKLIDSGVPKDDLMILSTAMFVVRIFTPLAISKYTSGPKPMSVYLNTTPVRLLWSLTYISFVYFTPMLIHRNGITIVPIYYYLALGFLNVVNEALGYIMIVATASFFSRISDPRFGGTYMTLLFTVSNLGMIWSSSLGLQLLDYLTFEKCSNNYKNDCSTTVLANMCYKNEGRCMTLVDGYYVEIVVCVLIGFIWYGVFKNTLKNFQTKSPSHWMVYFNNHNKMTDENTNSVNFK